MDQKVNKAEDEVKDMAARLGNVTQEKDELKTQLDKAEQQRAALDGELKVGEEKRGKLRRGKGRVVYCIESIRSYDHKADIVIANEMTDKR